MRTRLAVLLTATVTAAATVLVSSSSPASGQVPLSQQPFAAYGSGTIIAAEALTLGTTTVGNVHAAHSGGAVNSAGLTATVNDEFGEAVSPPQPAKNAYGRGTGLEVGLLVPDVQQADVNQLLLSGLAQASAPPPEGPITREVALDLQPVAFASLLRGQAQAIYDPGVCALGQPITYGRGYASNVQLVGNVGQALAATSDPDDNVSDSRTFTYFLPNGDGTFGLVSETRQHIAPITVLSTPAGPTLTIEVLGDIALRATATGRPGGAKVEFIDPPVLRLTVLGGTPLDIPLASVVGPSGLDIDLGPLARVTLGGPPRAIGGEPLSAPAVAPDGTSAAVAYDAIGRINLLSILNVLDVGIGHMEAAVQVPPGGIQCNIPVAKTATPNPAVAGQDVTWTITIPEPGTFSQFIACDLTNISATDTHSVESGNPRFQIVSASNGGVVSGNTITWSNLGTYRRGDPPIVLTVTGRIIGGSGVIKDTVRVQVSLTNCTGGVEGTLAGLAQFQGAAAVGEVTLRGPDVGVGNLAATGGHSRYLIFGGVLLLGAVVLRRRLKGRGSTAA